MSERFWEKVDKNGENGCWNWIGGGNTYGMFWLNGKYHGAHRISYIMTKGDIPDDCIVRHLCKKNMKCVNPEHLTIGTHTDNMRDKKRDDTAFHAKGELCGTSKITASIVKEIRDLYATGTLTQRQIGIRYNLCQQNIHHIVKRKTWTHIE